MKHLSRNLAVLAASLLIPTMGCMAEKAPPAPSEPVRLQTEKTAVAKIGAAKAAATQPANQNVAGTVTFTQSGDSVKVVADLTGLSPGKHGIHIHDKADLSAADLASAGGHWDPEGHKQHGGPTSEADKRHAGDLGNLEADKDGKAHYELTITGVSIGGEKDNIVGHSVIVHAKEDDMKTNPAGNAGGRVAGGVIEAGTGK